MQCIHVERILFKLLVSMASLICFASAACAAESSLKVHEELKRDVRVVKIARQGIQQIFDYVDQNPELFNSVEKDATRILSRQKRLQVWQTWQSLLDHILTLDKIGHRNTEYFVSSKGKKQASEFFLVSFAAFLTEYRYAMDFIERMELNPAMSVLLNDPVEEFGIESASYSKFKFRFLNILRGAEFARLHVLYTFYKKNADNPFEKQIEEDTTLIWKAGQGKGTLMTAENALQVVMDFGFTAWFPVQKSVASMMGNIKVWRPGKSLVDDQYIKLLAQKLKPGDILLERREWYATNLGIPGYWTHAALYIGTPEQRSKYFSGPEIQQWVTQRDPDAKNMEDVLLRKFPLKYQESVISSDDGNPVKILEAIEHGVSFTSLEHTAAADSIAVLRPKLGKTEMANAILRAFTYSGRPYDFNFDFRTDSELVCSELIYKVYEPVDSGKGLKFKLTEMMGRPILSPNNIAKMFAQEYSGKESQLDLVIFIDGNEYKGKAEEAGLDQFLTSWKRPKYHILLPESVAK